ncbi:class I SAM-dependent methyltransferase [Flavobacterium sp.]|jgi:predicted SAM-dependent methyltransferase|uniref:class I SAM-dependent methyltransferase n=1 Tax=Flavobacterium sp. TaxID=239 RepID=UPI0037BF7526
MKLLNLGCGSTYHKNWINIDFISNCKDVIGHNLLKGIPLKNDSVDVVYHSHVLEHFSKKDGEKFIKECCRVLNTNGIIRIAIPDLETIAKEYLINLERASNGDMNAKQNYEWIKLELLDQMVRNESGGLMKDYLLQPKLPNEEYVFNRIGYEGTIIRDKIVNAQNIKPKKISISRIKKIFKKLLSKFSLDYKIGQFRLGGEIHQWMYDRYSLSLLLISNGFGEVKICSAFESDIPNWQTYSLDVIDGKIRKPDSLFIEAKKI